MGLSTCLERWIPARSDCHAWCAWPILDFTRHHLGVQHAAPGGAVVCIAPETAGLDWATGRVHLSITHKSSANEIAEFDVS